jgi:two-component system sensor histidine kinase PhoQ
VNSLRLRLLVSAGAALLIFIVLTGFALNRALESYAEQAENDRLQGLVFSMLGAVEITREGVANYSLERVPEPRLAQSESGLSVVIYDQQGAPVWQSQSLLEQAQDIAPVAVNEWLFSSSDIGGSKVSYGFEWVVEGDDVRRYTLQAVDIDSPLRTQRNQFARNLWWWLLGISLMLLLIFLGLLSWGLKPLRRIRSELDAIRNGEKTQLSENAPAEILPLTQSVNALLDHEKNQRERFHNATADLAHSLKTPLAVLRNQSSISNEATEQLESMNQIISYQLQRASTSKLKPLTKPLLVKPVAARIIRALKKVYADKQINFQNHLPVDFKLRFEENDLLEMLGNLLENAAKYGQSLVTITGEKNNVIIEDDGPGFPENAQAVLDRGIRADTRQPGQGIGLSVAYDIIKLYSGELSIQRRSGKGARLVISFKE